VGSSVVDPRTPHLQEHPATGELHVSAMGNI
jgi:hypothetical protein